MRKLFLACTAWLALAASAHAAVGFIELPGLPGEGPVTVFYPSSTEAAAPMRRGPFSIAVTPAGTPVRGNGRLVVLSHGSGGSPWPQSDLARRLVAAAPRRSASRGNRPA